MLQEASSLQVIAIIPARGGSKRIPRKNLALLAGRPMLVHSISHAMQSRYVQETYVSTEDAEIAEVARQNGATVIARPPELANDAATSESALLHVLDERVKSGLPDPDLVVFLQCTSPVRRPDDIDRAVEHLLETKADSLFSACENKWFVWAENNKGEPYPLNYDYHRRQREQEMEVQYRENGSIFVFKPAVLRQNNNRMGGKIVIYEMDFLSSFQIDRPEDLGLVEWVLQHPEYGRPVEWPGQIDLVVFDFDGVMTDNKVWVNDSGGEAVVANRGDGLGIGMLRDAGVPMVVLSTERNPVVAARCAKLQLECHQGLTDKAEHLAQLIKERGVDPANVIYVGNDVNDLGCFEVVGLPVAVADAHPDVIAKVRLVLTHGGGQGAVRELADLLLSRLNR